jgi:3-oxoacyl-[acyl-carrier-protein] synthase-3
MKIKINAIEKYLPKKRISSIELDQLCNGREGRIEKNTGVKFRHHVDAKETVAEMGSLALKKALLAAKLAPKDLDLLIFSGAAYEYPVPHTAVVIKSKITDDTVNFNCIDVDSTCLSFLSAMEIAHMYIELKKHHRIAIVCSEISSCALTTSEEKEFGLFGDAAVAMIIEGRENNGYKAVYADFKNFPSGALYANVPVGGCSNRGKYIEGHDKGYNFKMDGKNLIRLTQKHIDKFTGQMENSIGYKVRDFDYFVTHQTSRWGNEFFIRNFKVEPNKTIETLSDYGNCISASIPLGLEKLFNSNLELKNKKVMLLGTGAGLTLGCMALEFD